MSFDSGFHSFRSINVQKVLNQGNHLRTHNFSFSSDRTGLRYIVQAEEYSGFFFALKFYCKEHKQEVDRFRIRTNRGDVQAILRTIAEIAAGLLAKNPQASFGCVATRSVNVVRDTIEKRPTARHRVYTGAVPRMFGEVTFAHYVFDKENAYLLINRCHADIEGEKRRIMGMMKEIYPELDV